MKQRRRIYYSAAQRSEIRDRCQAGEAMSSIGRRFDRESSSVFSVISPTGGIRPPDRHRAKQALSLSDREEIFRWLSMRRSLRSIRPPSGTISVNHQPGGTAQWRGRSLLGDGGRSGRLGSGVAPQALQAGLPPVPEAHSISVVAATMVTRADCLLVKTHLSEGV